MPSGRELYLDVPLSNMAMNYRPEGFIADKIAPIIPVQKQSAAYTIWSQADKFRVEDTHRAPGTEANKVTLSVSSATFFAENYALKIANVIEDIENADPGMWANDRQAQTEFLLDKLMLDMEARVALQCTSGSNVGSYAAVASGWGAAYAAATPHNDIWTAIDNVKNSTGYRPNSIIFGDNAWEGFRRSPAIRSLLYPHGGAVGGAVPLATEDQVKALFRLENVLIGGAYKNTGVEGATMALSQVWNDNVLVYYAPNAPSKNRPSFMYSMRWTKPRIPNMQVEVHPYDRKIKAEEIEAGYYQDEVITGAALGFLLTGVTTL